MKKITYTLALLWALSVTHGAGQWTDLTDGAATHDGATPIVLTNGHTYRPTSANAFLGSDLTLPAGAVATVGAASLQGFAGNTYTLFKVAAGGKLTLYGCDGVAEVFTALEKLAKGPFTMCDHTSGGLTISDFAASGDAAIADLTIDTFGTGTTLNITDALKPAGSALPFTLNVQQSAIVTLTTITSIPKLTGNGRLTLGASINAIPVTEAGRLAAFKGLLTTRSGGVTDIAFTADSAIWTLSGVTTVLYSVIKAMKGTVRLPASTIIQFTD
jgi:hypothetical protein